MEMVASPDGGDSEALLLSDFDYALPAGLIAQVPLPERDASRLLVLDRGSERTLHSTMRRLPEFLRAGDLLVFNDTRVRRARVFGRVAGGGSVELLLLDEVISGVWRCLGKPAKRLRPGTELRFPEGIRARVQAGPGDGRVDVAFSAPDDPSRLQSSHGEIPLPPYIKRPDGVLPLDEERYQTLFAAEPGAVAAPTAGLHFSADLLEELGHRGIEMAWLTLHVGPATFLPIREPTTREHTLEAETARIPAATADKIAAAKREGRRVIAIGTTTTRALESAAAATGAVTAGELRAGVFIVPGFRFRVVDAMLTNFHLPRSTLLVLVSAFAGRQKTLDRYRMAVREGYRFYSYGDAMLIT
jgi:S-adenosylmethionine:tRNA ribosyltransferase-isomerase